MAATNSAANNSPALPNNRRETANENLLNNRMPDELAMNFAALPNREREAVRQSLETGNIVVSEDLTLLREVPTRRGAEDITPIAPRNEATIEPAPVFRWQTTENAEYQITVTDRAGGEVAKSAALAENVWQIDKNLAAGFYFWKIAARNKG
ncbi:MAG: hypothetical protein LH472_00360, partial [Pyrinomonadaceae bacterium]|nr:hypothetical protein [Pyrinomonadaceae bacterium]